MTLGSSGAQRATAPAKSMAWLVDDELGHESLLLVWYFDDIGRL